MRKPVFGFSRNRDKYDKAVAAFSHSDKLTLRIVKKPIGEILDIK
jgi:hypothetical protein